MIAVQNRPEATEATIAALTSMAGSNGRDRFGYDAVEDKGRRRAPKTATKSEDKVLNSAGRKKLIATTRDVHRNYATAGWMIRCHLDYVARFTFQARTDDEELNNHLETVIKRISHPLLFDVAGRFSLSRMMRMSEARRVLDGDVFWAKLSSGLIQAIEGDRICTPMTELPDGLKKKDFTHGVKTSKGGRLQAVCVCKRKKGGWGFEFERIIPARHIWQHGYFDRIDQVRGISPLASALNTLQDTYEGIGLAMARAKVAQMFGLAIYRQKVEENEGWAVSQSTESEEPVGDETVADEDRYDVDPGAGPFKLELDGTDRAEFLTAGIPESEMLDFLKFTTDLTLKSLDIPYSFYDASKVHYYGQKADIQKYENSSKSKREDNQSLLNCWTAWRLKLLILNGFLELPGRLEVNGLNWEWVPAAMPWIDKLRDMKADHLAIENNLDSEVRIARRRGQDAREIVRERLDHEKFIIDERARRGLPDLSGPAVVTITDTDKGDDNA